MSETAQERAGSDEEHTYSGLFGAFPYAYRASDSRLFRAYVVLGGLLALVLALFFGLAIVTLLGQTATASGGTFTFSRSLFVLVGFFAVGPLVAPVLFVARQHRRGLGDERYDRTMALLGLGFVLSLYVASVVSIPPSYEMDGQVMQRDAPSGLFAPIVGALYALPAWTSPVFPAIVALGMYLVHRRQR
ncbi:hypothetical protein ACFPYI_12995 [Halomarina salina]|uniref:DUF8056 domain-containing protein n=1 Tax=Halomarina salina TaxID=1872699 RepID=A0ABD5RNN6_9EURY|nr:hypothetical protein [Halomarina salina]